MCQATEDLRHLLTCPDPRALKTRYDAFALLRKALDTSPGTSALSRAVQQWTTAPDDPVVIRYGATGYTTSIDDALCSQTLIGWENLLRGFISSKWGRIYTSSDTTRPDDRCSDAIPRLVNAIRALHRYTLALWTGRNLILHEHSQLSTSIVHAAMDHDIAQMYAISATFSDHLRSYFGRPLEARLRQSPRQRRRWLRLVRLATSHYSAVGHNQQLISVYFPYMEKSVASPPTSTASLRTCKTLQIPGSMQLQASIQSYFLGARGPASSGALVSLGPPVPIPHAPSSPTVIAHSDSLSASSTK